MSDTSSINAKAVSDMFRFVAKGKAKMHAVTKETLLEIGRRLVIRSPVANPLLWHPPRSRYAHAPGHFKNNWQVGIDTVPTGEIAGSDPTGAASLERLSHLGRWQLGHVYNFVNNVRYAQMMENGWSNQAPAGIVGLTRLEYQQIVHEAEMKVAREGHWAFTG